MAFHNIKNHLFMYDETTWGERPATPTFIQVPHYTYGVQFRGDRRNAATQTGLRQRKHGQTYRGMPSGQLTVPLYAWRPDGLSISLAQWLMNWGLADPGGTVHETVTLPSKGADYAEGPDVANKTHSGLRVNSTTLSGNGDAGTLELTLDLMGKDEDALATAQALPVNMYELTEFEYTDTTFSLDGTPIPVGSFQLTVANTLRVDYVGATRPTLIVAGPRVSTFQCTFHKEDDAWDVHRRLVASDNEEEGFEMELVMKGLHKGTGTAATEWSQCTLTLPMLKYITHEDQRTRDDIARLPLQFEAMKPDTLENDVNVTWADVA